MRQCCAAGRMTEVFRVMSNESVSNPRLGLIFDLICVDLEQYRIAHAVLLPVKGGSLVDCSFRSSKFHCV